MVKEKKIILKYKELVFLSKTFLISSDDDNKSYSPLNWFLNQILIPKTWVRKVEN